VELGLLFGRGGGAGGRAGGNGHRGGGGHAELLFHRLDQLHHLDEGLAADRFDDLLVGKGHCCLPRLTSLETTGLFGTRIPNLSVIDDWRLVIRKIKSAMPCLQRTTGTESRITAFTPPSAGRPRW